MASAPSEVVIEWWSPNIELYGVKFRCKGANLLVEFNVPDMKTHGLFHKKPADGQFHIELLPDSLSFKFWISKNHLEPTLECKVSNLPGLLSKVNEPRIKKGLIIVDVQKVKKESWDGKCMAKIVLVKKESAP